MFWGVARTRIRHLEELPVVLRRNHTVRVRGRQHDLSTGVEKREQCCWSRCGSLVPISTYSLSA